MKKLILFDIDGTLLLTGGAGKMAFNRVFLELYQIEEAWEDIHPDGRTDPFLINQLFENNFARKPTPQELIRVQESYTEAMRETLTLAPRFRLMPGVEALLSNLMKRGGAELGLATGNLEETAYLKLARGGLRDFFSFGGFGSDFRDRLKLTRLAVERGRQKLGRNVESEEILLVGDTPHDIRCGRLLGLTTVAVATGSTTKETLAQYRPDFLLDSLEPIDEVLTIFQG